MIGGMGMLIVYGDTQNEMKFDFYFMILKIASS